MTVQLKLTGLLIFVLTFVSCENNGSNKNDISSKTDATYIKDFDQYWKTTQEIFAYFDTRKTDWNKVNSIYKPSSDSVLKRIPQNHSISWFSKRKASKANPLLY